MTLLFRASIVYLHTLRIIPTDMADTQRPQTFCEEDPLVSLEELD